LGGAGDESCEEPFRVGPGALRAHGPHDGIARDDGGVELAGEALEAASIPN